MTAAHARQVAAGPKGPSRTAAQPGLLQRQCAGDAARGLDEEWGECRNQRLGVQRQASVPGAAQPVAPIVHQVLSRPGHPLDRATRQDMENRFGHDFGRVRVHADGHAAQSARAVDALAYTVGSHIVFAQGQYAPTSASGARLLAHELAHVAQQDGSLGLGTRLSVHEDAGLERQAEAAAATRVRSLGRSPRALQLQKAGGPAPAASHAIACSDPQTIRLALERATAMVSGALGSMERGPRNLPADPRTYTPMHHFYRLVFKVEPGPRSLSQIFEIRERFGTLRRALGAVATQCVAASHPDCRSGEMLHNAFATVGAAANPTINLCPAFFRGGRDEQARTVIHELAHARLGAGHQGRRFLQFDCGATPLTAYDDAINNAYVYDLAAFCLHALAARQAQGGATP